MARNFTVDDAMLADFKTFLTTSAQVLIDEEGWTKDQAFIKAMIRYEIDPALFSRGRAAAPVAVDPQAQYALSLFGEAESLTRLTARRQARPPASRARQAPVMRGWQATSNFAAPTPKALAQLPSLAGLTSGSWEWRLVVALGVGSCVAVRTAKLCHERYSLRLERALPL